MFLGIDIKTWLGLTALGAFVSTVGALLGIVIKDYFFSRSFERWKHRQSLEHVYSKYRDPLFLSAQELASRLLEICKTYPTVYLNRPVLESKPEALTKNSIDDPYYKKYKLLSTAYRLSALLGWIELYRQDVAYLHPAVDKHSKALETSVEFLRSALADGHINKAQNWHEWEDRMIFREELRAIGESMLEARSQSRGVVGYGRYLELIDSTNESSTKRSFRLVTNFLLDLKDDGLDFRNVRMLHLLVATVDLMKLLDEARLERRLLDARNDAYKRIHIPRARREA